MIQFKIRTEYSFGNTYAKIDHIVNRLKDIGCKAAGIVDQSTWGHVAFYKACKAAGIMPLLGVEIIVARDGEPLTKMWFLAKNEYGLKELYNFNSKSYTQQIKTGKGSATAPRLYQWEVVNMSDNIAVFAGSVLDGQFLHDCNAIIDIDPSSIIISAKKKQIAKEFGLKSVNISDNYFAYPEDKDTFDILVPYGKKMTPQYILDSFPENYDHESILESFSEYDLPKAPMIHFSGNLEQMCRDGIKYRKMESSWNDVYEARLKRELDLIKDKDFESYFLIVADMVRYAKEHMLVGPSRGSSAGSLVCYLTRITEIDPIPPGLYFERFIDISRKDLPDIDLDFPDKKRDMVFEYMENKYGKLNVARIGTISVYKPKSALDEACRQLSIPTQVTYNVKTAMITRSAADARSSDCLADTLNGTDPGKQLLAMYPDIIVACNFEGHASHTGQHAAGLLICNDDITNYCTVDDNGIAHCDKKVAEELNLLKIDVLGLRTLSVIEDSGVNIDWYNLPLDDPGVLSLFGSGKLCGLFQFEGQAMRSLAKLVKFDSIIEVDAVTALARPGPYGAGIVYEYIDRKAGKPYESLHPAVEDAMKQTYGVPLYQEQTIAIVREIGKFNWDDTTQIRKGISKSMGEQFMNKYFQKFIEGAASVGMNEKEATKTWRLINSMGSWQMNKAHTYSYAVISYWCAYLKHYHLIEFAMATLKNAKDEDSALELLRELAREGVDFVPFDIDKSEEDWSVKDGILYGGFSSLIGIADKGAKKYIDLRKNGLLVGKERDKVLSKKSQFAEIFPFHKNYADVYKNPKKYNIYDDVVNISDLVEGMPHRCERVFLGELVHKNARDNNEEMFVKKRGGKKEGPPHAFLDIKFKDDTELIGGRVGRYDFERIGREILDNIPKGAHLLVRAKFYNGHRYAHVIKWKRIDGDQKFDNSITGN